MAHTHTHTCLCIWQPTEVAQGTTCSPTRWGRLAATARKPGQTCVERPLKNALVLQVEPLACTRNKVPRKQQPRPVGLCDCEEKTSGQTCVDRLLEHKPPADRVDSFRPLIVGIQLEFEKLSRFLSESLYFTPISLRFKGSTRNSAAEVILQTQSTHPNHDIPEFGFHPAESPRFAGSSYNAPSCLAGSQQEWGGAGQV